MIWFAAGDDSLVTFPTPWTAKLLTFTPLPPNVMFATPVRFVPWMTMSLLGVSVGMSCLHAEGSGVIESAVQIDVIEGPAETLKHAAQADTPPSGFVTTTSYFFDVSVPGAMLI